MLRHCDLFAGIGGFTKAAKQVGGIQTTQFVEIDPDAAAILRSQFPGVPIHSDIRNFSPEKREFDLITGGWPCNNTSCAGDRTGLDGEQSRLWREMLRVICIAQPRFVVMEQPEGLVVRGLRAVLGALRMAGYKFDTPILLSAALLGAMHQRNRLFIVSYANELQFKAQPTSWDDQMREMVEEQRANSRWLTVERRCDRSSDGIPRGLVSSPLAVRSQTPGRIRARVLAGRTVTPPQAAIALSRVLYLNSLCK